MNNKNISAMKFILNLIGGLAIALHVQAASFDCAKARSTVEHLICDDQAISKIDDELSKAYKDVLSRANDEQKQRVISEQKHWLKFTRSVCANESCLKHAYWSRIAELETFLSPHSPIYENESDKADTIKNILGSAPLYPTYDTPFCKQISDDLKQMKDVHFVDPIVQVLSYEDPALDQWKSNRKIEDNINDSGPLNYIYACEPGLYPGNPKNISSDCSASYGLPPFKLFELPPLNPAGPKRHIFYFDGAYGPLNQEWKRPRLSNLGDFRQIDVSVKDGAFAHSSGGTPNYNSIIEYRNNFYFLILSTLAGNYLLDIESVEPYRSKNKQICHWSSVENIHPGVLKPRKNAKPLPSNQGED